MAQIHSLLAPRLPIPPRAAPLLALSASIIVHALVLLSLALTNPPTGNTSFRSAEIELLRATISARLVPGPTAPSEPLLSDDRLTSAPTDAPFVAPVVASSPPAPEPSAPKLPVPPSDVPLLRTSTEYYPLRMLTRPPRALTRFTPQLPAHPALTVGESVTIRLWMDTNGKIERIASLDGSFSADVEEAALKAFQKMRFSPGEIEGIPVKSMVDIVLEYGDPETSAN